MTTWSFSLGFAQNYHPEISAECLWMDLKMSTSLNFCRNHPACYRGCPTSCVVFLDFRLPLTVPNQGCNQSVHCHCSYFLSADSRRMTSKTLYYDPHSACCHSCQLFLSVDSGWMTSQTLCGRRHLSSHWICLSPDGM